MVYAKRSHSKSEIERYIVIVPVARARAMPVIFAWIGYIGNKYRPGRVAPPLPKSILGVMQAGIFNAQRTVIDIDIAIISVSSRIKIYPDSDESIHLVNI